MEIVLLPLFDAKHHDQLIWLLWSPYMLESYGKSKIVQKANFLKSKDLYPFFRAIESSNATTVTVKNKQQIMIGSNNYLGLTHHPEVIEASVKATKKFGTGCTGSRFLNGNLSIHEELEEKLAQYVGHDKAIVFSTGMQSNLGAISCLAGPRDCLIFDSENHASLIDASRLSFGTTFKFKHNDMSSLEDVLKSAQPKFKKRIIVADGIFSMTGDIIKLPQVIELAKKYEAIVYIDDAHGLGVLGENGRGTASHFGLTNDIHFNMGTFSKSFASIGGFVSGPKEAMDFVKHSARSFMFSASMPPSAVATVSKCIDIVKSDDSILKNLWSNVEMMRKGYSEMGLFTYNSQTPIIPIYIGDDLKALTICQFLSDHGIFTTPVLPPAVPEGEALIRTSYMASHTTQELTKVLEVMALAKKEFDIPSCKNS